MLADDLSRNRLSLQGAVPGPATDSSPPGTRGTAPGPNRLDITSLASALLQPRPSRLHAQNISVQSEPIPIVLLHVWGHSPVPRVRGIAMLFRDVAGAGGRGPIYRADVPRGSPSRPDHVGTPGTTRLILAPPPAPGPERDQKGARPHRSAFRQTAPPGHAGAPPPDAPAGPTEPGNSYLPGNDALGGHDRLLFRFFPRGRDHRTDPLGIRRSGAPRMGRCRDR